MKEKVNNLEELFEKLKNEEIRSFTLNGNKYVKVSKELGSYYDTDFSQGRKGITNKKRDKCIDLITQLKKELKKSRQSIKLLNNLEIEINNL